MGMMGGGLLPPEVVPPNPTKRELQWGKAYPCLRYGAVGQHTSQCPGLMQPGRRCFRYEGKLWRRFKCDRPSCGREATDWKDEDGA